MSLKIKMWETVKEHVGVARASGRITVPNQEEITTDVLVDT